VPRAAAQGDAAKPSEQGEGQALLLQAGRPELVHGLDAEDRHRLGSIFGSLAQGSDERGGFPAGADHERLRPVVKRWIDM